jgi:hypothetical protein
MQEGFVPEEGHLMRFVLQEWIAGKPEFGPPGLRMEGKERRAVRTFRCVKCGYLESYAIG